MLGSARCGTTHCSARIDEGFTLSRSLSRAACFLKGAATKTKSHDDVKLCSEIPTQSNEPDPDDMQHNFQHASFDVNDDEGQGRVDRSRDTK